MDYLPFIYIGVLLGLTLWVRWRRAQLVVLALGHLGFKAKALTEADLLALNSWTLRSLNLRDKQYVGHYNGRELRIIIPSSPKGAKVVLERYVIAAVHTKTYAGAILSTPDLENQHGLLLPPWPEVDLEFEGFNQAYSVYTPTDSNQYYDVDPETMSKLLDLRKTLRSVIIETHENTVYTCFVEALDQLHPLSILGFGEKVITEALAEFLDKASVINEAFGAEKPKTAIPDSVKLV